MKEIINELQEQYKKERQKKAMKVGSARNVKDMGKRLKQLGRSL